MSWPFRLWYFAAAISILSPLCQSTSLWNTLYSYDDGKIYMHLKEGSLIALNFTVAASDLSLYDLKNNQQISPLPLPPTNASLFLAGTSLYGIAPNTSSSSSSHKKCADGLISLYKYDPGSMIWKQQNLDFSGISDPCFYLYLSIMASPTNNQTAYIFGGKSLSQGAISDRLISLDLDSLSMANISTTTTPRPFYGAGSVLAPSVDSQLFIGGESQYGWLSMYQLASWSFVTGWSSHAVSAAANASSAIESRVFSLALPVFSPISDSSLLAIASNLTVKEVLVVGGVTADGSNCSPGISKLDLNTNIWSWQTTSSSGFDPYGIVGAATILNTLVVINGLTQALNKRAESLFTVSLYDVSTLEPVKTVQENWRQLQANTPSYSHGSNSVAVKAVVGTVVPVFAIVTAIIIAYFVIQHRRKQTDPATDNFSAMEYEFGNFYSRDLPRPDTVHLTPFAGHEQSFEKMYVADPNNQSGSTLGDESMSSWMLKKKLYDHGQTKHNEGGQSDHRLSNNDSCETISVASGLSGFSPITSPKSMFGVLPLDPITMSLPITSSPQTPSRPSRTGHRNPLLKPHEKSHSGLILLFDETRDVQVLVSSKRRLVLRIANPDTIIDDEDEEDDTELPNFIDNTVRKASGTNTVGAIDNKVRQRTPTEEANTRAASTYQLQ